MSAGTAETTGSAHSHDFPHFGVVSLAGLTLRDIAHRFVYGCPAGLTTGVGGRYDLVESPHRGPGFTTDEGSFDHDETRDGKTRHRWFNSL